MSDVRALLRQQRAARRVEDPYAAYSSAGKLRCTLCPPTTKGDLVWEAHVRSNEHRQRVQAAQKASAASTATGQQRNGDHSGKEDKGRVQQKQQQQSTSHKRKLDDEDEDANEDVEMEDDLRRKRSRPDMPSPSAVADKESEDKVQPSTSSTTANSSTTHTPPSAPPPLSRRTSRTPSLGVEIQIPSRPATPAHHREGSSSSTPGTQSQPQQPPSAATAASSSSSSFSFTAGPTAPVGAGLPSRRASTVLATHPTTAFAAPSAAAAPAPTAKTPNGVPAAAEAAEVDADEWAAFEAEIAAEEVPFDADAVIARPAMTAEESAQAKAAAAAENDEESRRAKADVDLEDEKEEAALALEREFDDMEELEARVRRLKNKREELRRQRAASQGNEGASINLPAGPLDPGKKSAAAGEPPSSNKENEASASNPHPAQPNDDEDDDDDDDDDWDGFRFRTS
ncbi:Zinc finger protein [Paramyrothecium foliicola]|nr:Zinc finger protein [Paramyrothecium foliicola]